MYERIVIVGAGQAAAQAVETLRRRGFTGRIVLAGAEEHLPYQRPPLSKKFLAGTLERERLTLRPAQHYADHAVELQLGRRAMELDRSAQRIRLDDGVEIAYDALLLATGARPRMLAAPGGALDGVHYLRTIADVERLRPHLLPGRRLVIIGGGYIGLEVAATCREHGLDVTVLEMTERVMSRVVCAPISAFFEAEHARRGVRILCGMRVQALIEHPGTTQVRAVRCEDGSEHAADLVLVGVGAAAEDSLAAAAGLDCVNGIVVDERCRTSDPHIFAAGDCTNHPSLHYGYRVRLESVDNAFEQGASAALAMLGEAVPHDKVPWFWSDQYDLKLIIVGLCTGADAAVARGQPASRSFSVCYLRGGELIAVDTVNNVKDQMAARKLIAARMRPDPAKLADPAVPLRDCA
ncbi:MAG TPA: FAD-dependent oxidoreductase [Steroidobacteraceae bacterium]|nr:FAD-dependent oxidoreductase [Steroidobacteraceae bacterium]